MIAVIQKHRILLNILGIEERAQEQEVQHKQIIIIVICLWSSSWVDAGREKVRVPEVGV